ncbi:PREDICTED: lissencephaly-1 homolog [Camelina sativa]|uniref:Lissencephaly-1 homolog n=1 Tax=Camelina sativa TaxID=90675 RepID=A0ABM1RBV1_CAMSA|nr:PREDICTED: lissencephaly-1 homolog [Camelina sativa]
MSQLMQNISLPFIEEIIEEDIICNLDSRTKADAVSPHLTNSDSSILEASPNMAPTADHDDDVHKSAESRVSFPMEHLDFSRKLPNHSQDDKEIVGSDLKAPPIGMHWTNMHVDQVHAIFDCSGRYVITGSDDRLVKIWSMDIADWLATCRGHEDVITDLVVNSNSTFIASASKDCVIRVWRLPDGLPVSVLYEHTGTVTFSPKPGSPYQLLS